MVKSTKEKVPVTKHALVQRINRALKKDGEKLQAARGMQAFLDLGDFYTIDVSRNFILEKNVDLEKMGRRLGVLKPFERLAE
jgi:hypothetical protein